jgi:hypothetical protein
VAPERVDEAMRRLGYFPAHLVSPRRAREVARAVGADWLVTGRWIHLDVIGADADREITRFKGTGRGLAVAELEAVVWDMGAAGPPWERTYYAAVTLSGGPQGLAEVAVEVLRKFAADLRRL